MSNIDVLTPVLDLVMDGVMDGVQAVKNGKDVVADAPLLMQLIKDVAAAGGQFAQVPSAVSSLSAEEIESLVAHAVVKLAIADEHARLVVQASLKAAASVAELVMVIMAKPAVAAPVQA